METIITIPPIPLNPPAPSVNTTKVDQNHFLRLTGSNELVFLELQGSIARLDENERRLGRLVQEDDGRIYLIVGYQKMEGKIVTLKTPFAVLRKKETPKSQDQDIMDTDELQEPVTQDSAREEHGKVVAMEIVDVCRKKIYFGNRPEPMNDMETAEIIEPVEPVEP